MNNNKVDKIELLIDNMKRQSHAMEYEDAQRILDKIKEELLQEEPYKDKSFEEVFVNPPENYTTIKDMYLLVTSHSIRLDMNDYNFDKFLDLLINLKERKSELQGGRYVDIDRQRKIVAEEMFKIGMQIPCKWKGNKPNRAFLEIAYKVNPSLCSAELLRREKVMMWKAIETGKELEKEKTRKKLRKYKNTIYES